MEQKILFSCLVVKIYITYEVPEFSYEKYFYFIVLTLKILMGNIKFEVKLDKVSRIY
jgi:hypothetical protein